MASRVESEPTAAPLPIHIAGLRFRHPERGDSGPRFELAIDHLDLPAGQSLACIGPSGCGKSTLLHLMAGILLPDSGRIRLGEADLTTRSEAARRNWRISNIGLVFQEFELLEHLSVRENVLLPYLVNRNLQFDSAADQTLHELADRLGITAYLGRKPQRLSQGERQRVALCRALVTRPRLLFADEPTGNLDPENTAVVVELLLEEVRRRGTTLVVVTHDHDLVPQFDQVLDFRQLYQETR